MFQAILFDLDDTLLGNSMESFIPAYFQALTRHVGRLVPPDRLIAELMKATQAMNANDGTGLTNKEKFVSVFFPALDCEKEKLMPIFRQFYAEKFPRLRPLTQTRPEARSLIEWGFRHDLQVVIATNPIFPRMAIEQRLAWAGAPVTEFDYALVTTYENMHATKSHPAYYREIVARLGRQPGECLMVGNDWERDIAPAASVGLTTYWIATPDEAPPTCDVTPAGQGRLASLQSWLESEERG